MMRCARHARLSAVLLALAVSAVGGQAARAHPRTGTADAYPRIPAGPATFVRALTAHSARHARRKAKPHKRRLSRSEMAFQQNEQHAIAAYQAMQQYFYIAGTGLYKGQPYSFLWPFSQALAATVAINRLPGQGSRYLPDLHARMVGLQAYYDANNSGANEGAFTSSLPAFDGNVAPPRGPGGAKFYDDNDWVGIELIRVWELTGEAAALEQAEQIMAFEMSGWQANPKLGCSGGVPFSNSAENGSRNTVSTAPAAELALLLYRATDSAEYLQFAEMAYAWVRQCLLLPSGLYADHIGARGVVEQTRWSYNQGTMIGAGVLLYEATGDGGYLDQARQTARAALAYFTLQRLAGENPFFVAVYLRNLLYLDALTGDYPGPSIAARYLSYLSARHRPTGGLFATSVYQPQLLVQASITQVYALLCSEPASYF